MAQFRTVFSILPNSGSCRSIQLVCIDNDHRYLIVELQHRPKCWHIANTETCFSRLLELFHSRRYFLSAPIVTSVFFRFTQAQQEVPEWLESAAQGSIGTGGYGGAGGSFGGTDVRRGGVSLI